VILWVNSSDAAAWPAGAGAAQVWPTGAQTVGLGEA